MSQQHMTTSEITDRLRHFTGSQVFTRYLLGVMLTEGVRFLCEAAGAFWLADAVISYRVDPIAKAEPFQVWTLTRKGDGAVLTMTDGNDKEIVRQEIEFTDFPLPEITLWLTDNVLLLPSEY